MRRFGHLFIALIALGVAGHARLPALALGIVSFCAPLSAYAGSKSKGSKYEAKPERFESEKSDKAEKSSKQDKPDKDEASGKETADSKEESGQEAKSGKSGEKEKSGHSASETNNKEKEHGNKVPGTVEEWLTGILKPKPADEVGKEVAKDPAKDPVKPKGSRTVAPDIFAIPAFERPELLVSNASKANIDKAVALKFRVTGRSGVASLNLGLTKLMAPDGYDAAQARDLLERAFPPGDIEPNKKYRIFRTATGTEPAALIGRAREPIAMATPCGTDRCFGVSIIGWSEKVQECARSVRVGIIDTGYDRTHPALRNRQIEPRDVAHAGKAKSPDWHGTGVLALLAGEPKSGTPGLVPDAKLYMADIFYADTDGAPASDTASLIEALDWLDKQKVSIINMSLTGPPDELLKQAILGLAGKGIMFVAAAGNDGPSAPPSYPAAYEPVLAVTAVDRNMKNYRYAGRGNHVDLSAPGVDIWTAMPHGEAGYHSGTSFAVPYVTAILAATYKGLARKTKKEFLKQATVIDLGETGRDPVYGNGLLVAPLSCVVATAETKPAAIKPAGLLSARPGTGR